MLVLLASPPVALGLTASRAHAAAGRLQQPRTPPIAALAAGGSSALSFEEWAAASGIQAPNPNPNPNPTPTLCVTLRFSSSAS